MKGIRPSLIGALGSLLLVTPALGESDRIANEKGFSIHEVDAEAGLQPAQPRPGDQKVLTWDGHAYWLRPVPIVLNDFEGVRLLYGQDGKLQVWLRLTPEGQRAFASFTSTHVGQKLAFVLDGKMIGPDVVIMGPVPGPEIAIPVRDEIVVRSLADKLARVIEDGDSKHRP